MTLENAYLFLRVSPLQCLSSVLLAGSPFPSHPTGRSVFPSPAVRQSSFHSMRRLSLVPDDSAPDVNDASGIQGRIRVFLPPEASTSTTKVQVPAKANVDESLQAAKCLACVGVAEVICPTAHRLIHLLNKLRKRNCRPPLGEVFNPQIRTPEWSSEVLRRRPSYRKAGYSKRLGIAGYCDSERWPRVRE